ncbi:hypothetical protein Q7C_63 [Methylophaga frappieri]|uniref:Uncharacterized protein n=1 Tax=Methylophaga frappieri (strain ATCC BAA-2434 / DSM 25690 / JAM7) TaxID=754477 RepID=I1YEA4_METFJ|nr:PhnD/SsuA/transferrin family substrate-binding protein [Methylophaga frappieri]AFJ01247.1 hypothetical protein Q7C_63 [Methylophaga frappieri]
MKRIVSFILLGLLSCQVMAESEIYNVGIEPSDDAMILAQTWIPLLKTMSSKMDAEFRFRTAKNIVDFNQHIKESKLDFIIASEYLTSVFYTKYDVTPLVKFSYKNEKSRCLLIFNKKFVGSEKVVSVGIARQQNNVDSKSVFDHLSNKGSAYFLQTYQNTEDVIKAVREGLSQYGVVQFENAMQASEIRNLGLEVEMIDENDYSRYFSVAKNVDDMLKEKIASVLITMPEVSIVLESMGIIKSELINND